MKKFIFYSLSILSLCSSNLSTASDYQNNTAEQSDQTLEHDLKSIAALGDELFKKTINFLQLIETDKKNITVDMIDELDQLLADIVRFTKALPEENQAELLRHVEELKPVLGMARKALLN
jgi:hypothetical protein